MKRKLPAAANPGTITPPLKKPPVEHKSDTQVREACEHFLSVMGGAKPGPVLEELFQALASRDDAVRAGAHAALLALGPHAYLHLIQAMIKSPDAAFRTRAVGLLAELAPTLPDLEQMGVICALVDRSKWDEDAAIRTAAALALQALEEATAAELAPDLRPARDERI